MGRMELISSQTILRVSIQVTERQYLSTRKFQSNRRLGSPYLLCEIKTEGKRMFIRLSRTTIPSTEVEETK